MFRVQHNRPSNFPVHRSEGIKAIQVVPFLDHWLLSFATMPISRDLTPYIWNRDLESPESPSTGQRTFRSSRTIARAIRQPGNQLTPISEGRMIAQSPTMPVVPPPHYGGTLMPQSFYLPATSVTLTPPPPYAPSSTPNYRSSTGQRALMPMATPPPQYPYNPPARSPASVPTPRSLSGRPLLTPSTQGPRYPKMTRVVVDERTATEGNPPGSQPTMLNRALEETSFNNLNFQDGDRWAVDSDPQKVAQYCRVPFMHARRGESVTASRANRIGLCHNFLPYLIVITAKNESTGVVIDELIKGLYEAIRGQITTAETVALQKLFDDPYTRRFSHLDIRGATSGLTGLRLLGNFTYFRGMKFAKYVHGVPVFTILLRGPNGEKPDACE
ncbi:unnamed protein product [Somion occarium]|uniref:Uncharacterized protein n=1 Tax=Somion occarium TaxID=3059160 RepID=A0ABP1CTA7_9APHY